MKTSKQPWEILKLESTRAIKCCGCKTRYADAPPERGLVFRHFEADFKAGTAEVVAPGNRYYHLDEDCVQLRHGAEWNVQSVTLEYLDLSDAEIKFVKSHFGIK